MSKHMIALTLLIATGACTDGPFEPEVETLDLAPQLAVTSGPWTKDASAMVTWNGVSVWRHANDGRIVLGFGRTMAKYAAYTGSNNMSITTQRLMFEQLGRDVGAGMQRELERRSVIEWLHRVRGGKSVGLWVLAFPSSGGGYTVVAVQRRPKGNHTVPWI